jgi:hypothetical protein
MRYSILQYYALFVIGTPRTNVVVAASRRFHFHVYIHTFQIFTNAFSMLLTVDKYKSHNFFFFFRHPPDHLRWLRKLRPPLNTGI